jgi:hypothetical protein
VWGGGMERASREDDATARGRVRRGERAHAN